MDEQASFEARAVLAPKHVRRTRLVLLLPAVALVATAWAGLSGAPDRQPPIAVLAPTAVAETSLSAVGRAPTPAAATAGPARPSQVFGLPVRLIDTVQPAGMDPDEIVVLTGWYAPT